MLYDALNEALDRLDRWLVEVCHSEERRAKRLVSAGGDGWDGIRSLLSVPADELALSEAPPPLVPVGVHVFTRLCAAFHLDAAPLDALLVLLAPHVEPRYQSVYAVLQDDLNQPWCTERLLLTVLGRTRARRHDLLTALRPSGVLLGSGLVVEPVAPTGPLGRAFDLAPEVREAALGLHRPHSVGPVAFDWWERASDESEASAFAVVHGSARGLDAAHQLAAGRPLLTLEADDTPASAAAIRAAWRIAICHDACPVVDLRPLNSDLGARLAMALYTDTERYGGRWIVHTREPLPLPVPHVQAPRPAFRASATAWSAEAERRAIELSPAAVLRLASNHRLPVEDIARAFDAASDAPSEITLNHAAYRLARADLRHGRRIDARRTFEDLVVRDSTREALHRLVYYIRHRDRIGEDRALDERFRLGHGPIVLFSGRPGTGKTLAAEVIAKELDRPLYVVDLAQLVDKYIGETEKNIDRVLREAEQCGAALFFDDADALFTNRTEVSTSNDRYANLEVGFLLQRIEGHSGLVILATNLRQNLDDAFVRRFHARIEFPRPEPIERRQIWERMLPETVSRADALDLDVIAERYTLTGAEIRNASIKAVFLAEESSEALSAAHVDEAIRTELLELGRLSRARESATDYGELIRSLVEKLELVLAAYLRQHFVKEVHIVHGAPTKEALAGFRPAVSIALYSVATPRPDRSVRLGAVISTWSKRAEEEYELLGVVHEAIVQRPVGEVHGRKIEVRVQDSYDFDLLQRFWTSHNHPVRAGLVVDIEVM